MIYRGEYEAGWSFPSQPRMGPFWNLDKFRVRRKVRPRLRPIQGFQFQVKPK